MSKIYIDKRYFAEKAIKWVSFENTPRLKRTKSDIYGRCVPCITNLYEQLKEGKKEIHLGTAYQCWKVVVVLQSTEACVELLTEFEKNFLGDRAVKGRFGSGDESKTTKVIVFNADDEAERDRLCKELKICAEKMGRKTEVLYHRACAELYHELFGNWVTWKETETIKKPEMVEPILERIQRVLFWKKDERG